MSNEKKESTFKKGIRIETHELDATIPIQKQVNNYLDNYYKQWLDMEIPGLNNMTPRQASMSEEGRKLLEELFVYMKKMPSAVPFPFEDVKKELGI